MNSYLINYNVLFKFKFDIVCRIS